MAAVFACASTPAADTAPEARLTSERVAEHAWWPTSGKPEQAEFAGTDACGECHGKIVRSQRSTRMARAAQQPGETGEDELDLSFRSPKSGIETTISTGNHAVYTTKGGGQSITGNLLWTMGDGEIGKTFIVESGGALFEGQLSYFTSLQALDLTPGHTWEPLASLNHQFGEKLGPEEARRCFACHSTGSTMNGQFDQTKAIPGITCEACHGPGKRHVEAMQRGHDNEGIEAIFNPANLSPAEQVDFCGACHRAPMDVRAEKSQTAINIRFQPYRLAKSRCWSRPDARLTCIACHSPHTNLKRDPASYDAKCLACHRSTSDGSASTASATEAACPVGTSRCVTCHMPRYQLPQLHGWFTDHDIRIVRPGEAFPL